IITYMKKEIATKIDEKELIQIANVDITTIRRHFKTHYNTSPMAFHRKLRLAHAKMLIEKGIDYKNIPANCGFKSDSGFRNAFVKEFGHPPGEYNTVMH
ncbi:MAG: helix-turn-helix domain-containing protein, partial [Promethearchaeota archaeon]